MDLFCLFRVFCVCIEPYIVLYKTLAETSRDEPGCTFGRALTQKLPYRYYKQILCVYIHIYLLVSYEYLNTSIRSILEYPYPFNICLTFEFKSTMYAITPCECH